MTGLEVYENVIYIIYQNIERLKKLTDKEWKLLRCVIESPLEDSVDLNQINDLWGAHRQSMNNIEMKGGRDGFTLIDIRILQTLSIC